MFFSSTLRETARVCYCYYSCSLIDPLSLSPSPPTPTPTLPLSPLLLLLLLLFPPPPPPPLSSSPHPLQTHCPCPKKKGSSCPALSLSLSLSPRPDPCTIQSSGLNNASAAAALKGTQEQFSAGNNAAQLSPWKLMTARYGGGDQEMEREGTVK